MSYTPPLETAPCPPPIPTISSAAEGATGLRGDIMGGLTAILVSLPMILSCGAVVYQPLGTSFIAAGVAASLITGIAGALVPAILGGQLHVNAPRATQAALLAAMMAELAAQPAFRAVLPAETGMANAILIVMAGAALAVAGLAQILLGALRLGDLVKYVPQTIVAGFVAGFAIQIITFQTPFLLGLENWSVVRQVLLRGEGGINLYALILGLLAAAITLMSPRLIRQVPGALIGLVAGTLVDLLVRYELPGLGHGPLIGALPEGLALGLPLAGLGDWFSAEIPQSAFYTVVATGLTLAFITSIQSLLSVAAADSLFGSPANSNRELAIQGACNFVSAVAGGTATGGSPLLTRAAFQQGGRRRWVNVVLGLGLVLLAWVGRPLVGAIPLSVLAAVVIVATAQGLDDWTKHLLRALFHRFPGRDLPRLTIDVAVLALVSGLVAFVNVPTAIGIGMLVTVAVFLRRSSSSPVRRIYHGDILQSNTIRANVDAEILEQQGRATVVIELQGPVFFGSADILSRSIETAAAGASCAILDFRRVTDIDSTSALILQRVDRSLAEKGCRMVLAGLSTGSEFRRFFLEVGFDWPERDGRVFGELDFALADAEDRLLADVKPMSPEEVEIPLIHHPALSGLNAARLAMIEVLSRRMDYGPGEAIYREGDVADAVYLLVKGAATRQRWPAGSAHPIRQTGYRAGALFGEAALFRGGNWTGEVVTDTPVVCYRLVVEDLLMVDGIDPRIALTIVRNIANGLIDRIQFVRQVQWARAQ